MIGKKINKLVVFSLLSGLILSANQAWAQNEIVTGAVSPSAVTLTAVPPRLGDDYSLVVSPGQTTQAVIEVRNPSDTSVSVDTFARDFIIGEDGETPVAVEDEVSSRWSLASWLTITPSNVVIKPRGSSTVTVNIAVPADALPGGHYAMVLHRPAINTTTTEVTGAEVTAQVGTLFYVVVDGEVVENADVQDFAFAKFSEFGPVAYSYKINNGSSLHIRPEATITVKNMLGKEVAVLSSEQKNIFPEASREFTGEWKVDWGFGRYTAVLNGTYGENNDKLLSATTTFWIVPVRTILAVLLVIVLIILITVTTRKRYAKMLDLEEEKVKKLDEKLRRARQEEDKKENEEEYND